MRACAVEGSLPYSLFHVRHEGQQLSKPHDPNANILSPRTWKQTTMG